MKAKQLFKVGDKAILHNREVTISKIEWEDSPEYLCFMYSIKNDMWAKATGTRHRYHEGMFKKLKS